MLPKHSLTRAILVFTENIFVMKQGQLSGDRTSERPNSYACLQGNNPGVYAGYENVDSNAPGKPNAERLGERPKSYITLLQDGPRVDAGNEKDNPYETIYAD